MFDYMSFTDSKCVQILAPQDTAAVFPANYLLGERLGNVSREVAAVLADLMDIKNILLDECNVFLSLFVNLWRIQITNVRDFELES